MAFDFPANPSLGQPYVASGITYIFDGIAWNVSAAPNAALPLTADSRNRLCNPNMRVSQENGDAAGTASLYYAADQWLVYWSAPGGGQAAGGRVAVNEPTSGTVYAVHAYVNTADAAPSWFGTVHYIEGLDIEDFLWGTTNAKQAVLRFWVFSQLGGTYGGCIRSNAPAARTFVFSFTVPAATWTEVVKVIPGDTGGTAWNLATAKAAELWFTWAAGAAQLGPVGWNNGSNIGATGQSNGFASTGNHFYLTDVGLYKDPLNTGIPPRWEAPAYDTELRRCKRYWQTYSSMVVESSTLSVSTIFQEEMRVTPTVSSNGTGFVAAASLPWMAQFYQTTRNYANVTLNARM